MKARHFILALRDYFHDQAEKDKTSGEEQQTQTLLTDRWAFQYIDIPYLQPILEAIDDDASGFIRISEVNTFTVSKPADWRFVIYGEKFVVWFAEVPLVCLSGLHFGQLVRFMFSMRFCR